MGRHQRKGTSRSTCIFTSWACRSPPRKGTSKFTFFLNMVENMVGMLKELFSGLQINPDLQLSFPYCSVCSFCSTRRCLKIGLSWFVSILWTTIVYKLKPISPTVPCYSGCDTLLVLTKALSAFTLKKLKCTRTNWQFSLLLFCVHTKNWQIKQG
jgi:hypothetical protein